MLITFYIASKNKREEERNKPEPKPKPKKKGEYTVDELTETLDFLVKHQLITPQEYNQLLLKSIQFL